MSGVKAQYDTQLYNFVPTLWICTTFLVLFSLLTIVHLAQAIHSRLWWLLPTLATGAFLEVLGWSFRLWSSKNPRLLDPFLGNLICLGLGPVFVLGSLYLLLGLVINNLGPQYSRLRPRTYALFFSSADLLSLVIQSVGGAMASIAAQSDDIPPPDPNKGARVILGGIVVQEAFMCVYIALGAEFIYRWALDRPLAHKDPSTRRCSSTSDAHLTPADTPTSVEKSTTPTTPIAATPTILFSSPAARPWKTLLLSLALSTTLIFIRSLYRTAELSQGWSGPIISSERLFNVLDGAMMVLALVVMAVLHPGRLLRTKEGGVGLGWRREKEGGDA